MNPANSFLFSFLSPDYVSTATKRETTLGESKDSSKSGRKDAIRIPYSPLYLSHLSMGSALTFALIFCSFLLPGHIKIIVISCRRCTPSFGSPCKVKKVRLIHECIRHIKFRSMERQRGGLAGEDHHCIALIWNRSSRSCRNMSTILHIDSLQ